MQKQFLEAGKIVAARGVHGELKVYPYCDSAEMLCGFRTLFWDRNGERPVRPERCRAQGNMALIKLPGIGSPEEAHRVIGRVLYFDRREVKLAPGVHFVDDLLGARVVDADSGACYGKIADITQTGAHDVYHIETKDGGMRYIPAVPAFVTKIDPEGELISIRPIPGMLDE